MSRLHRLSLRRVPSLRPAFSGSTSVPNASSAASSHSHQQQQQETQQETHFGFETVPVSSKASRVHDVFDRVASKYDRMNDVMSLGIHRLWKDYVVSSLELHGQPDADVLDVAGGTGDIAFRCLEQMRNQAWSPLPGEAKVGSVTIADINEEMLKVGRERARRRHYLQQQPQSLGGRRLPKLDFVCDDAETLVTVEDDSKDVYTIAFGLRNVTNPKRALETAQRVLRRGGRFVCLEFSNVKLEPLRRLYDLYSFNVIPAMGRFIASDSASYEYLVQSIRMFPDQATLADMMTDAGFGCVRYENLAGGIAAVHTGFKL